MKLKPHIYLYIIIASLFLGIVAPNLFSDGMFMDGLIYASISKNMAHGIGSFWAPHFSLGLFPEFYEHPPLAFGLQSIWFRIFGDSFLVERFYSLFTYIVVGYLIATIWKQITKSYKLAWLPLLFWILVAKVSWACSNNMLENTMTVFVCASILIYLKNNKNYWFVLFSGLSLSLALLTKGFVCLYVWTVPLFFWLVNKQDTFFRMVLKSILLIIGTVLPILLLYWLSDSAANNMLKYFNKQVLGSIQNVATVQHRYTILIMFFQAIVPSLILFAVLLAVGLKKYKENTLKSLKNNASLSLIFALVMFAGILPIMISMKQRGFYIVTVYPFFAISLALLLRIPLEQIMDELIDKRLKLVKIVSYNLAILAFVISIFQFGRIGRDKNKLEDCYLVIDEVGNDKCINFNSNLFSDWSLHGYFARYGHINLIETKFEIYDFYLTNDKSETIEGYEKVDIDLHNYYLYKKE